MYRIVIFDALLAVCCGYALWRGGPPERVVGGSLILAYVATLISYSSLARRFYGVEQGVFATDVVLLVLLIVVAIRADRGWPLVVAALQLDTVGTHVLKQLDPGMIRVTYALLIAVWSYPMLLVLGIGTFRHQARLGRLGYDTSWSLRRDGDDPASRLPRWMSGAVRSDGARSNAATGCTAGVPPAGDLPQGRRSG